MRSFLTSAAIGAVLAGVIGAAAARQDGSQTPEPAPPPAPQHADQAPQPDAKSPVDQSVESPVLPPSAYTEGERPPAKEKLYRTKPAKVWSALLDALKKTEVPVESSDEAAGSIQTRLIPFQYSRFFDVATRPPAMTRERPVYQLLRLNQGWFSVEIHLAKVKGGTNVSIRAYIEEGARDLNNGRIRAERYSNGKIEDYFFAKLDESLK